MKVTYIFSKKKKKKKKKNFKNPNATLVREVKPIQVNQPQHSHQDFLIEKLKKKGFSLSKM
jgi:hypothetical protein